MSTKQVATTTSIPLDSSFTARELELKLLNAVSRGDMDTVMYLSSKDAVMAEVHKQLDRALTLALNQKHPEVFWYLVKNHDFNLSKNFEVLSAAAGHRYLDIVQYLVGDMKIPLNNKNNDVILPAVINNQPHVLRYLVEQGADLTKTGYTQLKFDDIGNNYLISVYANLAFTNRAFETLKIVLENKDMRKLFFSSPNNKEVFSFHMIRLFSSSQQHKNNYIDLLQQFCLENPVGYKKIKTLFLNSKRLSEQETPIKIVLEKIELGSYLESLEGMKSQKLDTPDTLEQSTAPKKIIKI